MDEEESIIEDSLNYKHHAVIAVGILLAILAIISIGYWVTYRNVGVATPATQTATSTVPTQVATSTSDTHAVQKLDLTEHAQYYDIDTSYPSTAGLPGQTDAQAIAFMKGFVQNTIDAFKESGNFSKLTPAEAKTQGLDRNKYSLGIDYVTYHGARTVSYVYTIEQDTGGAHPNTFFRTFTFDTSNGGSLGLAGLFKTGTKYLTLVSTQTRADLPAIIKKLSGYSVDTKSIINGTQPQEDSFQNFAIDGNTLRIIFPPAQVGPYSLGTVVDPIPLASKSFKAVVLPQYIGS
jgi:hypothetical protein